MIIERFKLEEIIKFDNLYNRLIGPRSIFLKIEFYFFVKIIILFSFYRG